MRSEIDAIGGQEVSLPTVQPAELQQESSRSSQTGRFKDHNGREMVLASHARTSCGIPVKNVVHSYRQLPALMYHIQPNGMMMLTLELD